MTVSARPQLAIAWRTPLYRNAYGLMVNTVGTAALGVAFWVVVTHRYQPSAVGLAAARINLAMLLSSLAQMNLAGALNRFLPETALARRSRFVLSAYCLSAVLACIYAAAFVIANHRWHLINEVSAGTWTSFALLLAATLTWTLFTLQDAVLTGLRAALWVPAENFTYGALKLAAVAIGAAAGYADGIPLAWFAPALLLTVPVNALVFRRLLPQLPHVQHAQPVARRTFVSFVLGDYIAIVFAIATSTLLPLLVLRWRGAETAGFFAIAWLVSSTLDLLSSNLATSLLVESTIEPSKRSAYLRGVIRHGASLVLPMVAVCVVGAGVLLRVFGRAYQHSASTTLRLLVLAVPARAVLLLVCAIERHNRRVRLIIVVYGASAIGALGGGAVLVDHHGAPGVALAWFATQTVIGLALLPRLLAACADPDRSPTRTPARFAAQPRKR